MPSLATTYLGLSLKNPLIASSCPLTSRLETARALEAAGVGAIVVRSIFEEQIREEVAHMYDALAESGSSAALDYLRADLPMRLGPEKYIENLKALRTGLKILGVHSEEAVMIGDRMDTDMVAGIETGLDTVLVLSGVTDKNDIKKFPYRPRLVLNGVGDIPPAAAENA